MRAQLPGEGDQGRRGYASVMPGCASCAAIAWRCAPNGAKRAERPRPRAAVLAGKKSVYVSLAPSYIREFPDVKLAQMNGELKQLGFSGVSETALGAQQVSAQAAALLQQRSGQGAGLLRLQNGGFLSAKSSGRRSANWTGLLSPLLTHCRMLRQEYGQDIGVVSSGRASQKNRSGAASRTAGCGADVRRFAPLAGAGKNRAGDIAGTAEDHFVPERSAEGAWYPVDGGMIAGMKSACAVNDCSLMAFSGLRAIKKALNGIGG